MSPLTRTRPILISIAFMVACSNVTARPVPNAQSVVIEAPTFKPGDRWNYTNGYFAEVVGLDDGLVVTTSNFSRWCKDCRYYRDTHYTAVKILDGNGRSVGEQTGGEKLLDFPLRVGKKWDQATRMKEISTNRPVQYSNTYSVEAFEEITVAAGTFKAFRIRWYSRHPDGTWSGQCDVWWSPDVRNFIKRSVYAQRWFDDFELVSYIAKH
jgi:hypothetical protein